MAMRYYAPLPDPAGEPYRPMRRHVLRIGDSERDAAAADLGDHYVAGRLTLDELHDRLGEVFEARTHGQLGKVMADLPGPARPGWPTAGNEETAPAMPAPRRAGDDISSDRAGRFAALSLLILAMLIWLFTVYLFARHGAYAHAGPGPFPK